MSLKTAPLRSDTYSFVRSPCYARDTGEEEVGRSCVFLRSNWYGWPHVKYLSSYERFADARWADPPSEFKPLAPEPPYYSYGTWTRTVTATGTAIGPFPLCAIGTGTSTISEAGQTGGLDESGLFLMGFGNYDDASYSMTVESPTRRIFQISGTRFGGPFSVTAEDILSDPLPFVDDNYISQIRQKLIDTPYPSDGFGNIVTYNRLSLASPGTQIAWGEFIRQIVPIPEANAAFFPMLAGMDFQWFGPISGISPRIVIDMSKTRTSPAGQICTFDMRFTIFIRSFSGYEFGPCRNPFTSVASPFELLPETLNRDPEFIAVGFQDSGIVPAGVYTPACCG